MIRQSEKHPDLIDAAFVKSWLDGVFHKHDFHDTLAAAFASEETAQYEQLWNFTKIELAQWSGDVGSETWDALQKLYFPREPKWKAEAEDIKKKFNAEERLKIYETITEGEQGSEIMSLITMLNNHNSSELKHLAYPEVTNLTHEVFHMLNGLNFSSVKVKSEFYDQVFLSDAIRTEFGHFFRSTNNRLTLD